MQQLFIDIETFSNQDLRKSNVYRYSEDPDFEIMMAAYAIDDGPVLVALGAEEINAIPGLWDPAVEKIAHNAPFERVCFSAFLRMLAEMQDLTPVSDYLDPEEWTDTMMWAAELGLPQSLGALAVALGAEEKDEAGTRLINLFCKPYRGRRVTPEEKPDDWKAFINYCIQDVATLRDVHHRLMMEIGEPTEREMEVFHADQQINDYGIKVDVNTVKRAILAAEQNAVEHMAEAKKITGLENPNSTTQLMEWFKEQKFHMDNLQAATVQSGLERAKAQNAGAVARVLELRQEMALTASKKFGAIMEHVCSDDRLRGQFRFFGAHTGRWSGKGVQLHNLARHEADDVEAVLIDLALGLGATSADLKGIVRAVLMGPFAVVDYSAIEARVLAWLAGEDWVLQAFRDGQDLYVVQADKMSALIGKPYVRKDGKIAVLALGYNGSIGSLRAMGAEGTDEELYELVGGYRESVPHIVGFWKKLEVAFRRVAGRSGREIEVGRLTVKAGDGNDVHMVLPSGRALVYHNVRVGERIRFKDARGWTDTYGGRLTENATQAVARDILAEALVALTDEGYNVAGHVHDEVLVDLTGVPSPDTGDAEEHLASIESIMTRVPDWATGLPLAGEGFVTERYKKG